MARPKKRSPDQFFYLVSFFYTNPAGDFGIARAALSHCEPMSAIDCIISLEASRNYSETVCPMFIEKISAEAYATFINYSNYGGGEAQGRSS